MIETTYKHTMSWEWERPVIVDWKWNRVWYSSYSLLTSSNIDYRWWEWQAEFRLRRNKIKSWSGEKTNVFPIEVKGSGILEILVGN